MQPALAQILGDDYLVEVCDCDSQVGSGALPLDAIPSAGLIVRCRDNGILEWLTAALRELRSPVIGRIVDNGLLLDLRCLESEETFLSVLSTLDIAARS